MVPYSVGLQFCIKAIQDFAYSGFGGRGGRHGDILWDNDYKETEKELLHLFRFVFHIFPFRTYSTNIQLFFL